MFKRINETIFNTQLFAKRCLKASNLLSKFFSYVQYIMRVTLCFFICKMENLYLKYYLTQFEVDFWSLLHKEITYLRMFSLWFHLCRERLYYNYLLSQITGRSVRKDCWRLWLYDTHSHDIFPLSKCFVSDFPFYTNALI